MFYPNNIYSSLISYGIHVGHSFQNTVLYSAWLVLAFRQDIALINLFKFVISFRASSILLANLIQCYYPIWYINLDVSMEKFVGYAATMSGEHFTGTYWCRGLISNFLVVANSYRFSYTLPSYAWSRYQKYISQSLSKMLLGRISWPRLSFISSVFHSYFPAKESLVFEIPAVGVVDTNTLTQSAAPPLPGNDDSSYAIIYYNSMYANFLLKRKFNSIIRWFEGTKRAARFNTFQTWFARKSKEFSSNLFSSISSYDLDESVYFKNTIRFFFSKSLFKNRLWFPLFKSSNMKKLSALGFEKLITSFFNFKENYYATSVFNLVQLYTFLKTRYYSHYASESHFAKHRFYPGVYRKLRAKKKFYWYRLKMGSPLYRKYFNKLFLYFVFKTYVNLNPRIPALGMLLNSTVRKYKYRSKIKRKRRRFRRRLKGLKFQSRVINIFKRRFILKVFYFRAFLMKTIWSHIYNLWGRTFYSNNKESLFFYNKTWMLKI